MLCCVGPASPRRIVGAVRRMSRRVSEQRVDDRIRVIFEDSAAVMLRFGKENANRIAKVARRMADPLNIHITLGKAWGR